MAGKEKSRSPKSLPGVFAAVTGPTRCVVLAPPTPEERRTAVIAAAIALVAAQDAWDKECWLTEPLLQARKDLAAAVAVLTADSRMTSQEDQP